MKNHTKILFFLVLMVYLSISTTSAAEYRFDSIDTTHEEGYAYAVSITYIKDVWIKRLVGYDENPEPSIEEYPEIFNCLGNLTLPPDDTPGEEWDILEGTYKGFHKPEESIILVFMPAIFTAVRQEYLLESSSKEHEKGHYSASLTCKGGRWWRLGRAYYGLPKPSKENQVVLFQILDEFEMPEDRSCLKDQEWETYLGQWVWFD